MDDALLIGNIVAAGFTAGLPQGFHIPLKGKVITMEVAKKGLKNQDVFEYNMGRLYARLLVLSQTRYISLQERFNYELSSVPASLLNDYGLMRKRIKVA